MQRAKQTDQNFSDFFVIKMTMPFCRVTPENFGACAATEFLETRKTYRSFQIRLRR